MYDGRLLWMEGQAQSKPRVDGLQSLVRALPLYLPVAIPDSSARLAHAGDFRSRAICSFRVIELFAIQIAQGQMRQIKISYIPGCRLRRVTADCLAKKCQFETVVLPARRLQIPRVIPPLRLKARVIEIISWKFESITRQRRSVLPGKRVQHQKCQPKSREPTPHEQTRADSVPLQPVRGTNRTAPWPGKPR